MKRLVIVFLAAVAVCTVLASTAAADPKPPPTRPASTVVTQ